MTKERMIELYTLMLEKHKTTRKVGICNLMYWLMISGKCTRQEKIELGHHFYESRDTMPYTLSSHPTFRMYSAY